MKFRELFEDKSNIGLVDFNDQNGNELEAEDSGTESDVSEIELDNFDDEPNFDFNFPKNSVCAAHTLQLVLKDVFENCSELKLFNQVKIYAQLF